MKFRNSRTYRLFSACLSLILAVTFAVPAQAQSAFIPGAVSNGLNLPAPGTMVGLTPAYSPAMVRGITIYPDHPLQFDFIIDAGDDNLEGEAFRAESTKLVKYFLASLTVPEDEMWVNLSPYEKDRIVPESFGRTEMGRDLLAQDYMLKQLTASLMYPEEELGAAFWDKVFMQAREKYGKTEVPTNVFNKVWIVPDKAAVYVHGNNVFVAESHLKVMMEADYAAMRNDSGSQGPKIPSAQGKDFTWEHGNMGTLEQQVIREVIIPAIEKEVNEGKTFANLRQIYNASILATWYKQNLKASLLGQKYVDKNKVAGVDIADKDARFKIYDQYIEAFRKGVYNFIREDVDQATREIIPRHYFSGGASLEKNVAETGSPVTGYALKEKLSKRPIKHVLWRGENPISGNENFNAGTVNAAEISGIMTKIEKLLTTLEQTRTQSPYYGSDVYQDGLHGKSSMSDLFHGFENNKRFAIELLKLQIYWEELNLLSSAKILTPETRVYSLASGIDFFPSYFSKELLMVDFQLDADGLERGLKRFKEKMHGGPFAEIFSSEKRMAKIRSLAFNLRDPQQLRDWASGLKKGDVIFMKFTEEFLFPGNSERSKKEWLDNFLEILPEGVTLVIFNHHSFSTINERLEEKKDFQKQTEQLFSPENLARFNTINASEALIENKNDKLPLYANLVLSVGGALTVIKKVASSDPLPAPAGRASPSVETGENVALNPESDQAMLATAVAEDSLPVSYALKKASNDIAYLAYPPEFNKQVIYDEDERTLKIKGVPLRPISLSEENQTLNNIYLDESAQIVYRLPPEDRFNKPWIVESFLLGNELGLSPKVYGYGRTANDLEDGFFYIGVEAIQGESFDKKKAITPEETSDFIATLAVLIKNKVILLDMHLEQFMWGHTKNDAQDKAWVSDAEFLEWRPYLTIEGVAESYYREFNDITELKKEDFFAEVLDFLDMVRKTGEVPALDSFAHAKTAEGAQNNEWIPPQSSGQPSADAAMLSSVVPENIPAPSSAQLIRPELIFLDSDFDLNTAKPEDVLEPSDIRYLEQQQFPHALIKQAVRSIFRTSGINYGFGEQNGLAPRADIDQVSLIKQEFSRIIAQKKGGKQEINIVQMGIGSNDSDDPEKNFKETREIFQAMHAVFDEQGLPMEDWTVNFVAVDVNGSYIKNFVENLEIHSFLKAKIKTVQADALDAGAMQALGEMRGPDLIFSRNMAYPNHHAAFRDFDLGVHQWELEGLWSWWSSAVNKAKYILNAYITTRNIIQYLASPESRFIMGTGIYRVIDPQRMEKKGLKYFLENMSSAGRLDAAEMSSAAAHSGPHDTDQAMLATENRHGTFFEDALSFFNLEEIKEIAAHFSPEKDVLPAEQMLRLHHSANSLDQDVAVIALDLLEKVHDSNNRENKRLLQDARQRVFDYIKAGPAGSYSREARIKHVFFKTVSYNGRRNFKKILMQAVDKGMDLDGVLKKLDAIVDKDQEALNYLGPGIALLEPMYVLMTMGPPNRVDTWTGIARRVFVVPGTASSGFGFGGFHHYPGHFDIEKYNAFYEAILDVIPEDRLRAMDAYYFLGIWAETLGPEASRFKGFVDAIGRNNFIRTKKFFGGTHSTHITRTIIDAFSKGGKFDQSKLKDFVGFLALLVGEENLNSFWDHFESYANSPVFKDLIAADSQTMQLVKKDLEGMDIVSKRKRIVMTPEFLKILMETFFTFYDIGSEKPEETAFSHVIENLGFWRQHSDNLSVLLQLAKRRMFFFGGDLSLSKEILRSRVLPYINQLEEISALSTMGHNSHIDFRKFIIDPAVDLRTRMKVAENYTELVTMRELVGEDKGENGFRTDFLTAYDELHAGINELISGGAKKLPDKVKRQQQVLRTNFLQYLLGRRLEPEEDALLEDAGVRKQILTIVSIISTLEHAESFQEGDLARHFVKNAFNVLLKNFRQTQDIDTAKDAVTDYVMGITVQDVKDALIRFHPDDQEEIDKWFADRKSNKEMREHLIGLGVNPELWTKGLDIRVKITEALTEETKRAYIMKATYELVETVLSLGVTSLDGELLTLAFADKLDSHEKAKNFYDKAEARHRTVIRDKDDYLVDILDQIKNLESRKSEDILPAHSFRARAKKGLLEEGVAGLRVSGCFNPKGIHREMPIVHGLEGNAFFIEISSDDNTDVANAVMIIGSNGEAYVYGGYVNTSSQYAGYDLDKAFAQVIREMLRKKYVTKVILTPASAGYSHLVEYGEISKDPVKISKPATIFTDQYFDHGAVDKNGDLALTLNNALVLTRDMLFPDFEVTAPSRAAAGQGMAVTIETGDTDAPVLRFGVNGWKSPDHALWQNLPGAVLNNDGTVDVPLAASPDKEDIYEIHLPVPAQGISEINYVVRRANGGWYRRGGLDAGDDFVTAVSGSSTDQAILSEQSSGGKKPNKIQIDPILPTHGRMYDLVKENFNGGKRVFIFNMDAHHDKYSSNDITASWARKLEEEGLAVVIHLPSAWKDGETTVDETNLWHKRQEYIQEILKTYSDLVSSVADVWLTIDLDFFSFRDFQFEEDAYPHLRQFPIYHMDESRIDHELTMVIDFLRDNNIQPGRVIPSYPHADYPYLNVDSKDESGWIKMVEEKITAAFSRFSEENSETLPGNEKGTGSATGLTKEIDAPDLEGDIWEKQEFAPTSGKIYFKHVIATSYDPWWGYDNGVLNEEMPFLKNVVNDLLMHLREEGVDKFKGNVFVQNIATTGMNRVFLIRLGQNSYILKRAWKKEPTAVVKNEHIENQWSILQKINSDGSDPRFPKPIYHNTINCQNGDGSSDAVAYLLMTYISNKDLRQYAFEFDSMEAGVPDKKHLIDLAVNISELVKFVHGKGVIIRDIKPGNIFIQDDGMAGMADFDVSMDVNYSWEKDPYDLKNTVTATRADDFELAKNNKETRPKPDEMTDIYALGTIIFFMATGEHIFERKKISEIPDGDLSAVIAKATAARNVRYQTTDELIDDLRRLKNENLSGAAKATGTASSPAREDRAMLGGVAQMSHDLKQINTFMKDISDAHHNEALRFLKENGFSVFDRSSVDALGAKTEQLASKKASALYTNPLSGEFDYTTFNIDALENPSLLSAYKAGPLPVVEVGLFEFIGDRQPVSNLWVDNVIPIMGGEIYRKDGRRLNDEELAELGLRKILDKDGNTAKTRAFASGGRVSSLPGPWVVPYINQGEGIIILKTVEDVSRVAGRQISKDNLTEALIELAESGKVRLKLASDLQFKGLGAYNLEVNPDLPQEIFKSLRGKNVYMPGVGFDIRGLTEGGLGAATEKISTVPAFEDQHRLGGAIFQADTVAAHKMFDSAGFAELQDQEAWFSVRLDYNTLRASAYSSYDDQWSPGSYHTEIERLLRPLLQDIFKSNTAAQAMDMYLKFSAYHLAKNMRAFYSQRIARSGTSNVPDNYGIFFEVIDTDGGSIQANDTGDGAKDYLAFYHSWVARPFSMLLDVWKEAAGSAFDHNYMKEIFLPVLLEGAPGLDEALLKKVNSVEGNNFHSLPWRDILSALDEPGDRQSSGPGQSDQAMMGAGKPDASSMGMDLPAPFVKKIEIQDNDKKRYSFNLQWKSDLDVPGLFLIAELNDNIPEGQETPFMEFEWAPDEKQLIISDVNMSYLKGQGVFKHLFDYFINLLSPEEIKFISITEPRLVNILETYVLNDPEISEATKRNRIFELAIPSESIEMSPYGHLLNESGYTGHYVSVYYYMGHYAFDIVSSKNTARSGGTESGTKGGIDLNPKFTPIETRGAATDVSIDIHFNPAQFSNTSFDGLAPVIIDISPVTNLNMLLGIKDEPFEKTINKV
ncbi:MAG: hypothetical protein AB1650_08760 [Candidatus Omnitrophota bacterium]